MKPLYIRIREELADEIATQTLPPGARLESESDLATRFDCARMTVAKALQGLVERGLIERRRGVGTFVTDRFSETAPKDSARGASGALERGEAPDPAGAGVGHLHDAAVSGSTHTGAEFFCMWTVYNEIRRRAGSAQDIAARTGLPLDRVDVQLDALLSLGHIEREALGDGFTDVTYTSVQPAPYASIQKTMGHESELHSRHVALEKTRDHIVSRFDEERAGRTDFDYFAINASVVADDVALNELQSMLLSWIQLHRTKRKDVPMTHVTFLTTPVHPRNWTRQDSTSQDVILDSRTIDTSTED